MRPLFITGASRSGTSMTAGLFAAHGLWFGPCMEGSRINPKGFYESLYLKQKWGGTPLQNKQMLWCKWLADHTAPDQWAVKAGPEWWPVFKEFNPIVVCCYRDKQAIFESRIKAKFTVSTGPIDAAWRRMAEIPNTVDVHPDLFTKGDFSAIQPAFDQLGVGFSLEAANEWIDPGLWSQ
jgi:hypothetical protein